MKTIYTALIILSLNLSAWPQTFTNVNLTNQAYPQNEPTVRISRTNPQIIVSAFRDFRLGYKGTNPSRRIGYVFSSNGGLTWSTSTLLPAPASPYLTQSDPVVVSDASGNFYISSVASKSKAQTNQKNDILLYKSTNNGQTFSFLSVAFPVVTSGGGEDKEWMFCDLVPGSPTYNNIFITSTSFSGGGMRFVKSSNGGVSWTSPVVVADSLGQGSNVAVGTNGDIYVVWAASNSTTRYGIRFDKSTNGGVSFGTDIVLSSFPMNWKPSGPPFMCVDYSSNPTRGNIYVVWADESGGNMDVWFQRSTNAGSTWLASPVRVSDVTIGGQYWPSVQCDTNGVLYAIYYDTRSGLNSYFAYSTNAGDTWVNSRLSSVSFYGISVNSDVRFGDYIQIDAFAGKIVPVWTDDRAGSPNQEIYTAQISGLFSVTGNPITHNENNVPGNFALYQNYPNPFNPVTTIRFDLPKSVILSGAKNLTKLIVYDILGKEVATLVNEELQPGTYEIQFDASQYSSGIYYYELSAGDPSGAGQVFTDTKKMIIIK